LYFFSVLLTSPSLFSYPYSYSLHFPSFTYDIVHCSPSQLLFLPLLIHSPPCLRLLLLSSPSLSHITPPTLTTHYTLTTHWLEYCTNCTQYQSPAIQTPFTTTTKIHPNTQKGHETQQPSYLLTHLSTPFPALLFHATLTNSQKSITSLITITPPTVFIDIIIKGFSI
jgi:hypothetical protein